ncbi:hypothetical protein C8N35_101561 [Breoghania corrubedonensis]|uniref:Uncharacterized protein n=1 Tax=Breoghania corrubedonensis TaxID=665038 RepID=A0A2T5VFJ0_9HYPH|nr:hypothetical protein [Breoghania corrubedonensis]PTW62517.1 hypothetical protein C8N35_101561 [Breoghania corrubedonensis]
MHSKWPKRLILAAVVLSGLGVVALVGMDMVLSAPPIERTDLETLLPDTPTRVADIVGQTLDTVCVLAPHEKRVPDDARDAAAINDFLKTRTYGGDETHWAIVTKGAKGFALARFERSAPLDIAWGDDAAEIAPDGFRPQPCAPGATAALIKFGGSQARIIFGAIE